MIWTNLHTKIWHRPFDSPCLIKFLPEHRRIILTPMTNKRESRVFEQKGCSSHFDEIQHSMYKYFFDFQYTLLLLTTTSSHMTLHFIILNLQSAICPSPLEPCSPLLLFLTCHAQALTGLMCSLWHHCGARLPRLYVATYIFWPPSHPGSKLVKCNNWSQGSQADGELGSICCTPRKLKVYPCDYISNGQIPKWIIFYRRWLNDID